MHALAQGAVACTFVDSSEQACALVRENLRLNGFSGEVIKANVFDYLREVQALPEAVVLDPPAFAKTRKDIPKAAKAYTDINRIALKKNAGWRVAGDVQLLLPHGAGALLRMSGRSGAAGTERCLAARLGQPGGGPSGAAEFSGEFVSQDAVCQEDVKRWAIEPGLRARLSVPACKPGSTISPHLSYRSCCSANRFQSRLCLMPKRRILSTGRRPHERIRYRQQRPAAGFFLRLITAAEKEHGGANPGKGARHHP
jgi:hypothetical protein